MQKINVAIRQEDKGSNLWRCQNLVMWMFPACTDAYSRWTTQEGEEGPAQASS